MKITVVGTGYVGLVSGTCLAEVGNDVLCLDVDPAKIRILEEGGIPIYEPGLQEMVRRNVAAGRLHFTTDVEKAVQHGTIQFIAVGTPPDEDGSADLQYVLAAARNIGRLMTDYKVIVDKSTVPVGTGAKVKAAIADELAKRGVDIPYSVVSNPEFLKEGAAVEDFMRPDRIVVGAEEEQAIHLMRALYAPFQRNHERLIITDVKSAELTKYAANAMLATRISFMNELANLAEVLGADIEMVRQGIGSDPRIGYHFLYPGCGYGGSCFPKDVKALIKTASRRCRYHPQGADCRRRSQRCPEAHADQEDQRPLRRSQGQALRPLGTGLQAEYRRHARSAQPRVDRRPVRRRRHRHRLRPGRHARNAAHLRRRATSDLRREPDGRLDNADALVIVTEWKEFRSPDFEEIKKT
jgi:UDPglucose 6-dehydrogenase